MKKIIRKINNKLFVKGFYNYLSDEEYLKKKYKNKFGIELDLNNPITFNEKLQWLKIHDRKDLYTKMVDKYEAKKYVEGLIGKEYIIPMLGIYENFDEINFNELPDKFVIKCTHDSGGLVICDDKFKLNIKKARRKINKSLRKNYFYSGREWPYKNVKPRVIIEEFLDTGKKEISDYKFWCFNGEPKMCLVCTDRFINHKRNVYDLDWNKIDISLNFPNAINLNIEKPKCLNKMIELSRVLSKNIPFIRTDFYIINEKVYFGELTFFPGSGLQKIEPKEWNKKLGEMIDLNLVNKNEK